MIRDSVLADENSVLADLPPLGELLLADLPPLGELLLALLPVLLPPVLGREGEAGGRGGAGEGEQCKWNKQE